MPPVSKNLHRLYNGYLPIIRWVTQLLRVNHSGFSILRQTDVLFRITICLHFNSFLNVNLPRRKLSIVKKCYWFFSPARVVQACMCFWQLNPKTSSKPFGKAQFYCCNTLFLISVCDVGEFLCWMFLWCK